jgi:hypothetical protein
MTDLSDLEAKARERLTRMITNIDPDADVAPAAAPTGRIGAVAAAAVLAAAAVAGVLVVQGADGDPGPDDLAVGSGGSAAQDDGGGAALDYTVSVEGGAPTLSGTASSEVATVEVSYAAAVDGEGADAATGEAKAATAAGTGPERTFTVELPADAMSPRTEVEVVGLDEDGTEIGREGDVLRFLVAEESAESLDRCAPADVDEVSQTCEAG